MNKLQVSKAAQKDLQEIKAYLAVDLENPGVAVAAVSKITKKIRLLKDNPLMGPALTAVTDANSDERFFVCGNYLVFTLLRGKTSLLTAFFTAAEITCGSSLANRPIRCRRANFSRKNDTKSAAVRHGWEAPPRLYKRNRLYFSYNLCYNKSEGGMIMMVNTNNLVSITEANQNFSKVARLVDERGSAVILKNNVPRYLVIEFNQAEKMQDADDEDVMAISAKLMKKNREAYGVLAK